MKKPKKSVLVSITILLSVILTFTALNLCVNIFAMQIFSREVLPRGWKNYVGQFYRTLYVQAHDGQLNEWTAILGDSYAEGAGDAYLRRQSKYNLAQFLRDHETENFLIFGRSGFGSMRAVNEFLIASDEMSRAWFLPDLESPNEIIILFYEGNDLTDNIRHLKSRAYDNTDLPIFVGSEVSQSSDFRRKLDFYLPLLRPVYLQIKSTFVNIIKPADKLIKMQDQSTDPVNSIQSMNGRSKFRGYAVFDRLQSAATELSKAELDLSIDVFLECVKYVSKKYPTSKLNIAYIPSPVTVYEWSTPVQIETRLYPERNSVTKKKNDQYSEYIRNRIVTLLENIDVQFIDATERIRLESNVHMLHGPQDWKHLNGKGYELLAEIISEQRAK